MKIKCPVCKGTGSLPRPINVYDTAEMRKKMTRVLIKSGFSFRQVQKYIGYKSVASVSKAINEGNKAFPQE